MPAHVSNLVSILIFMLVASGFVVSQYVVVRILAPQDKSKTKSEPYECGEVVVGKAWSQISVRFYIIAMLFLVFDIETVFLFPWALIYKKLALFGLIEMTVFILILLVGLVYPWKKGVLQWETRLEDGLNS